METNHKDKQLAKEAERLAKEKARREVWFAREKAIEESQKLGETKRAEKRVAEEADRLAKEQKRKENWLAKEKAIEEAGQARKAREAKPDSL